MPCNGMARLVRVVCVLNTWQAAAVPTPVGSGVLPCQVTLLTPLPRVFPLRLVIVIDGEFDPGSGRTLAACLTHASRTVNRLRAGISGERVSNTWVTCP